LWRLIKTGLNNSAPCDKEQLKLKTFYLEQVDAKPVEELQPTATLMARLASSRRGYRCGRIFPMVIEP
jgi:hypothetical protein